MLNDATTSLKIAIVVPLALLLMSGCGQTPPPQMNGDKWAEALREPDAKLRKKAAFTLGNIGPSDPQVLPALIEALKDTNAGVRCEAILALLKVGPDAEDAIPVLIEIQEQDVDPVVREYAAKALEKLRNGSD